MGPPTLIEDSVIRESNTQPMGSVDKNLNESIDDEIVNTIHINSLVHIDLKDHDDQLAEIIRNEGVNNGYP